ncbi:ras-related protein Rab-15 isoform X2 [Pseudopipra pipra]|uniref:ras-related protein Rab-15 isoform X2 n=1 Tax=Pseudopipra pipra TaxID=415032 RepID=UPI00313885CE
MHDVTAESHDLGFWKGGRPVATPCLGQGHLPPGQVASSPIQPGLGHSQGSRGSHSFSGKSIPMLHHPHSKEFLPNIPSKFPLFHFGAIPPCAEPPGPCPKYLSSSPGAPLGTTRSSEVSLEPSLLQAGLPQLSPSLSPALGASPWPPLALFQQLHVLPMPRTPELGTVLQVGCHLSRAGQGRIILPCLLPSLPVAQPGTPLAFWAAGSYPALHPPAPPNPSPLGCSPSHHPHPALIPAVVLIPVPTLPLASLTTMRSPWADLCPAPLDAIPSFQSVTHSPGAAPCPPSVPCCTPVSPSQCPQSIPQCSQNPRCPHRSPWYIPCFSHLLFSRAAPAYPLVPPVCPSRCSRASLGVPIGPTCPVSLTELPYNSPRCPGASLGSSPAACPVYPGFSLLYALRCPSPGAPERSPVFSPVPPVLLPCPHPVSQQHPPVPPRTRCIPAALPVLPPPHPRCPLPVPHSIPRSPPTLPGAPSRRRRPRPAPVHPPVPARPGAAAAQLRCGPGARARHGQAVRRAVPAAAARGLGRGQDLPALPVHRQPVPPRPHLHHRPGTRCGHQHRATAGLGVGQEGTGAPPVTAAPAVGNTGTPPSPLPSPSQVSTSR